MILYSHLQVVGNLSGKTIRSGLPSDSSSFVFPSQIGNIGDILVITAGGGPSGKSLVFAPSGTMYDGLIAGLQTQLRTLSGSYAPLTTLASISANLQAQINNISVTGNYTPLPTTAAISANLQAQINNISVTGSYATVPTVAAISAALQTQILALSGNSVSQATQISQLSGNSTSQGTQITSISASILSLTAQISGGVGPNYSTQIAELSGNSISQSSQIAGLSGNSISQATQIAALSASVGTSTGPVSAFKFITSPGQSTIAASSISAALNIVGLNGITIGLSGNTITISGGGASVDVTALSGQVAGLRTDVNAISAGLSTIQVGQVNCNTVNKVYSIAHATINPATTYPVVSLEVPSISSSIYVQSITNRSATGFDVVLTGIPDVIGIKINWQLSSNGSVTVTNANFVNRTTSESISGVKTFINDVVMNGKLTVAGLIDPTGLELVPQTVNPGLVAANTIWLNSLDGNRLYLGSSTVSSTGGGITTAQVAAISASLQTQVSALSGNSISQATQIASLSGSILSLTAQISAGTGPNFTSQIAELSGNSSSQATQIVSLSAADANQATQIAQLSGADANQATQIASLSASLLSVGTSALIASVSAGLDVRINLLTAENANQATQITTISAALTGSFSNYLPTTQIAGLTGSLQSQVTINTAALTNQSTQILVVSAGLNNAVLLTTTQVISGNKSFFNFISSPKGINTSEGYGLNALSQNTSAGGSNTAIGRNSMANNTVGLNNTAIGAFSLNANISGNVNTVIGLRALNLSIGGTNNVAVGSDAGRFTLFGGSNILIGVQAAQNNEGSNNVFIGTAAAASITAGTGNVFIGHNAGFTAQGSNQLVIANSTVGISGALLYGDFSTGDLKTKNNLIWHAGNDGPGSGLDADLLGGITGTAYALLTTSASISAYLQAQISAISGGGSSQSIQIAQLSGAAQSQATQIAALSAGYNVLSAENVNQASQILAVSGSVNNVVLLTTNQVISGNKSFFNFISSPKGINTSEGYGLNALSQNTSAGGSNTAVGRNSMANNTVGLNNTAIGAFSLNANVSGNVNTVIGLRAFTSSIGGTNNVGIGSDAGRFTLFGGSNVAIGVQAGQNNEGSNNVFIGTSAGTSITGGSGNVFIGYNAGFAEQNSNKLIIANSTVGISGALLGGDFSTGDLRTRNNLIWHAGNDGPGSGLDADLLGGITGTAYALLATTASISAYLQTQISAISGGSGGAAAAQIAALSGADQSQATQIAQLSGDSFSQATLIAQLSGNSISQAIQITSLSGSLITLNTSVISMSAGLDSRIVINTVNGVNQDTLIAQLSGDSFSQATLITQLSGNSISQASQIASISASGGGAPSVLLTGNQSISGVKTFVNNVIISGGLNVNSIGYTPAISSNWTTPTPTTVFSALDRIAQNDFYLLGTSTDATPTEIFVNSTTNNRVSVPLNTTCLFTLDVVARRTDTGSESAAFTYKVVLKNVSGTVTVVGSLYKTTVALEGTAWNVNLTADDTNDALAVQVVGEAAKTINWLVKTTRIYIQ